MGEYRTPGSERWTPWVAALAVLVFLAAGLWLVPDQPAAGLLGGTFALAAFAVYVVIRTWAAWRRKPTLIRLSQNQISARRGDASVIAEIPYAAIATIKDQFWSDTIVVQGADGSSRIEIPLATKGIRELLIALADRIPSYLWELEGTRRFTVPFPWMFTLVVGCSSAAMAVCFYLAGWNWLAAFCAAVTVLSLAATQLTVRNYDISRTGVTIRRIVGARFVAATDVASVQLKRSKGEGPALYVSVLLNSGKRVGLMKAEQSAVVLYRALLDMKKAAA